MKELSLEKSPLADEMGISEQMLTILPRMIDGMKVILSKQKPQ
jgi:hypothetical protein